MSEEIVQRNLTKGGLKVANYEFYNLGRTTLKQLKVYNVVPKKDYTVYESYQPDVLLVDRTNKGKPVVVVVIEHKKIDKFKSESDKLKSVRQCNDVAQELGAKIGIATDGTDFIWFNPFQKTKANTYKDRKGKTRSFTYIQNVDGKRLSEKFFVTNKTDEVNIDKLNDKTKNTVNIVNNLYNLLDENNSIVITPEPINPMQLAKTVWQDIWIATGKSPEKCLYNVVELFIFKFLSDLEILKEPENFTYLSSLYEKGKTNGEVLDYYAKVCRKKIYQLFPGSKTDGTTIINGTIFVDEKGDANLTQSILFKNSVKKFSDFGKLQNIDNEFKTKLYETFLKETQGLKGLGQYFTPRKVVRAVVNMSGINELKKGQSVCDPFCGVGGFLLEPINLYNKIKRGFIPMEGVIDPDIKFTGFDKGSEKDEERTIILAKANMLIYLSEIITKYRTLTAEFSRVFNDMFQLLKTNLGTLGISFSNEDDKFDLILTNPPYVTKGKKTISNEITNDSTLSDIYNVKGIGLEGLALNWIIYHLKLGGSAFIIIPDGLLNRIYDRELRNHILKHCYLNAIVSLPKKTFFATSKKTYILAITKKDKSEDEQTHPIFTYLVDTIGERMDVTRFDIEENDLLEMTSLFNQFKGDKEGFSTTLPKCKIQPIERFVNEPSWIIDRWWTDEEKEALGIIEPEDVISLDEFQVKIDSLRESLLVAKKELDKITDNENITFEEFTLEELCDFSKTTNRSSFTRSFVNENKGDIPVYSASKTPDYTGYGNIKDNLPGVKYFENCLTWNIDGYVGKAFYRTGRFTLSEKVIPLILFEKYKGKVDYMYIRSVLQKEASKRDLGFTNKAGKARISDIPIKMPLDKKGNFLLSKQKELALNYKRIEDIKEQISEELKSFNDSVIEL